MDTKIFKKKCKVHNMNFVCICFQKDCKSVNRIGCAKCIIEFHNPHRKFLVLIPDLFQGID